MKNLFKRFNRTQKLIEETQQEIENLHKLPFYKVYDVDGNELLDDKKSLSESLKQARNEQLANIDRLLQKLEAEKCNLNNDLRYENKRPTTAD